MLSRLDAPEMDVDLGDMDGGDWAIDDFDI
jgi:hypothetical protein